jgi:hypothetical protein
MDRTKDQIAMDGWSAANLRKGLDAQVRAKIPAVEAAVQKGLTAANLRSGLMAASKPAAPPIPPPSPPASSNEK